MGLWLAPSLHMQKEMGPVPGWKPGCILKENLWSRERGSSQSSITSLACLFGEVGKEHQHRRAETIHWTCAIIQFYWDFPSAGWAVCSLQAPSPMGKPHHRNEGQGFKVRTDLPLTTNSQPPPWAVAAWKPLTFKNTCRNGNRKKKNGICRGPFLSTLSCVPKFVGMALSLIGNIWAAVTAWMLAEGSKQRGFVQEWLRRGWFGDKTRIHRGESQMYTPVFFQGDTSLPFLLFLSRACCSYNSMQGSNVAQYPTTCDQVNCLRKYLGALKSGHAHQDCHLELDFQPFHLWGSSKPLQRR